MFTRDRYDVVDQLHNLYEAVKPFNEAEKLNKLPNTQCRPEPTAIFLDGDGAVLPAPMGEKQKERGPPITAIAGAAVSTDLNCGLVAQDGILYFRTNGPVVASDSPRDDNYLVPNLAI